MLSAGFCTSAELKRSLGISSSDTTDDTLLSEIIRMTAALFEKEAGRTLRREYGIIERFTGGRNVLFLRRMPVVAIHSLRESSDRDFVDEDNYDELVEDEDFILDDQVNGCPRGFSAAVRRLDGNFMGGPAARGNIQVIYTAGYKMDAEADIENTTTTFGSTTADDAKDYVIDAYNAGASDERYLLGSRQGADLLVDASSTHRRVAVIRFGVRNTILPTWAIHKLSLQYFYRVVSGAQPTPTILPLRYDPADTSPTNLKRIYDVTADATKGIVNLGTTQWTASSYTAVSESTDGLTPTHANIEDFFRLIRDTLSRGFIAFKITPGTGSTMDADVAGHANSTSGNRPLLTIEHAANDLESYPVEDDMRHANIVQASHFYNEARKMPGLTGQSIRGVSIASGVAFTKMGYSLLPAVAAVAQKYAKLY